MLRWWLPLSAICLVWAMTANATPADQFLIVPGERIGPLVIGMSIDEADKKLTKLYGNSVRLDNEQQNVHGVCKRKRGLRKIVWVHSEREYGSPRLPTAPRP
jgi:hypothetical protein